MLQENKKNRGDLNLGYPTWLSLSNWAMQTIMSCPRDYQEVILHTLIGFREARDEPNDRQSGLEVIPRVSEQVALVQVDNIVLGESQTHMLVENINVT